MTTRTLSPDKQAQKAVTRVLDHEFLNAVRLGRQSARRKSPLPILNCVMVKKTAHRIEIISTDLETVSRGLTQTFYSSVDPAYAGPDFCVCIPHKPLFDWLRAIDPHKPRKGEDAQQLELEFEQLPAPISHSYKRDGQAWLKVKAGNTTARFYGIDALEFPYLDGRMPADGPLDRHPLAE